MKILTIDTSRNLCGSMLKNDNEQYHIIEHLERGHAERLIPQIKQLQNQANWQFNDLNLIAVNTGPGSFTGIRIGVAAARSFALALNIPSFGISLFTALAYLAQQISGDNIAVILPAYIGHYNCYFLSKHSKLEDICNIESAKILPYSTIIEKQQDQILFVSTDKITDKTYIPTSEEILKAFDIIARKAFGLIDFCSPKPIYMQPYK